MLVCAPGAGGGGRWCIGDADEVAGAQPLQSVPGKTSAGGGGITDPGIYEACHVEENRVGHLPGVIRVKRKP